MTSVEIATPCAKQADCLNGELIKIYTFLFHGNSIMTWVLLVILVASIFVHLWLGRIHSKSSTRTPAPTCSNTCWDFSKNMLNVIKESSSQFLVSYSISIVIFLIGVWLEATGQSGMMVQIMSFFPAIILALIQIVSILNSGKTIKKHFGV